MKGIITLKMRCVDGLPPTHAISPEEEEVLLASEEPRLGSGEARSKVSEFLKMFTKRMVFRNDLRCLINKKVVIYINILEFTMSLTFNFYI